MAGLFFSLSFLRGFLLALIIISFASESWLYFTAVRYFTFGLSKVEVYSESDYDGVSTEIIGIDDELQRFREEVYPLISDETDDFKKALVVKEWVMNQGTKVGQEIDARTPYQILSQMREGRGTLCYHMALVYLTALKSIGMEARLVQLVRSIYNDLDTHATVEVFVDGKWVIIDPTFNCYFLVDNQTASANQLQCLLLENESPYDLDIVYGAPVSYPAELQSCYLSPLVLYNNVFIYKRISCSSYLLYIFPYYFYCSGNSFVTWDTSGSLVTSEIKIQQHLSLAYGLVIPTIFILASIGFLTTIKVGRRRRNVEKNRYVE